MPVVAVLDMAGKKVGDIELSNAIFGIEPNAAVMHMAVVNYLANQRQGTQSTLTRSEVSGGGIKPWRQKGTGHARQGSIRAPQWRHGGIALGPKPRSYRVTLNKRVKRLALFGALSDKVANNDMIVIDNITASEYKTKAMVAMLDAVGAKKKTLVVLSDVNGYVIKSIDNLADVRTTQWNTINVYDIMNADTVVFAQDAVKKIEEVYAR